MNAPDPPPIRCFRCGATLDVGARFCRACGTPALAGTPEGADPLIGTTLLDRYLVVRPIGQGGMGRVYIGEQRIGRATRAVAIKVLTPKVSTDPIVIERFHREAATILQLDHPCTVRLLDFGEQAGRLFLVMEYVAGDRLSDVVARGPLSWQRAVSIAVQVAGSLDEAHRKGVIHRDLKAENVIVTADSGMVKVVDFGVAKHIEAREQHPTLTARGTLVGTPAYMSPEQFAGLPVDARSDVYALALLTWFMLAGSLPWQGKSVYEWATHHVHDQVPSLAERVPGLPPRIVQAIERALSKAPLDRPSSAAEFARELTGLGPGEDPYLAVATAELSRPSPSPPSLRVTAPSAETIAMNTPVTSSGRTAVVALALLFLTAIGAGFGLVAWSKRQRTIAPVPVAQFDASATRDAANDALTDASDARAADATRTDGGPVGESHPNWPRAQEALLTGLARAAHHDLEGALHGLETAQDLIGPTSIKLRDLRERTAALGLAAIRADLAANRCSAAQAKQRRLRRVGAEGTSYQLFGRRCPAAP